GTSRQGRAFLVMEYVDGIAINEFARCHDLSMRQRLRLIIDVANAIQHAHQKGVIHRDITPNNILVREVDGELRCKIIDFGLARSVVSTEGLAGQSQMTSIGQIIGTYRYMSPEQANLDSTDIDTRTDIYAIGIILYELLTGTTPLRKTEIADARPIEILNKIQNLRVTRPSHRLNQIKRESLADSCGTTQRIVVGGELDWILMKTLARAREERYQSAAELADDLRRFLDSKPISAHPPSLVYSTSRFIARNRIPLIFTTLAVAGLLIVTGLFAQNRMLGGSVTALQNVNQELGQDLRSYLVSQSQQLRTLGSGDRYPIVTKHREVVLPAVFTDMADSGVISPGEEAKLLRALFFRSLALRGANSQADAEVQSTTNFFQDSIAELRGIPDTVSEHIVVQRMLRDNYLDSALFYSRWGKNESAREAYHRGLAASQRVLQSPESERRDHY
ncbi:MAG: serine/threonine-protein kinase, partial [Planctomycetota bacterium]